MPQEVRRARVRPLAKLNLTLEVLNRRRDGYHDIRTIFQTITLADTLAIEYLPGARRGVEILSSVDIPNNLVARAGDALLDATRARGRLRFDLRKRIPMGGGLGGGSSDAAAVLLAVPVLTGCPVPLIRLIEIAAGLGSDVPFFLMGGTALGLGRGTEIYPLEDAAAKHVLLVAPGVHVSTAEAYSDLGRTLTSHYPSPKINTSQSLAALIGGGLSAGGSANFCSFANACGASFCSNDFESVVFQRHPELGSIKDKLEKAGAKPALMTGSGAALFGVFESGEAARNAKRLLEKEIVIPVSFVSRSRYHAMWWRWLAEHIEGKAWPPQSRYAR
jgi:4-diphosphocytidyl-2-C-methyl-D-erythritol kinase